MVFQFFITPLFPIVLQLVQFIKMSGVLPSSQILLVFLIVTVPHDRCNPLVFMIDHEA